MNRNSHPTQSLLRRGVSILALGSLSAALLVPTTRAASLTWDGGDATFGGSSGGTGTWDSNTTTNWSNASIEQTWTDTTGVDTATFAGTAGTVTVSGTVTANKLQFNLAGYTLTGGTIALAGTTPAIAFGSLNPITINSAISGNGLTITGSGGFLALTGNNSGITGTTTLNLGGGTLGLTALGAVASDGTNNGFGTSSVVVISTGTINYRGGGDGTTGAENIAYGNNFTLNGGGLTLNMGKPSSGFGSSSNNKTFAFGVLTFQQANTLTLVGSLTTNPADRVSFSSVSLAANGTIAITAVGGQSSVGAISETVAGKSFTLNGSGAGTLTISGASSYTGGTAIQTGGLRNGITNALPTGTTVTMGTSTALDLNGFNQTIGGLATTGTVGSQSITNNSGAAGTNSILTFDGINAYSGTTASTFSGVIKNGANKTIALTVASGNLTLSGANTYTGNTTLTGGTLTLSTAAVGSQVIAAGSNFVFNGGSLALGSTFNNNSVAVGTLSLTANSAISLGSGGGSIAFANSNLLDWGSFTLSITGSFVDGSSIRFGTDNTGLTAAQLLLISINGGGASLNSSGYLVASAIPEPATCAMILGLAALAGVVVRRRLRA